MPVLFPNSLLFLNWALPSVRALSSQLWQISIAHGFVFSFGIWIKTHGYRSSEYGGCGMMFFLKQATMFEQAPWIGLPQIRAWANRYGVILSNISNSELKSFHNIFYHLLRLLLPYINIFFAQNIIARCDSNQLNCPLHHLILIVTKFDRLFDAFFGQQKNTKNVQIL